MSTKTVKLRAGKYRFPVNLEYKDGRIYFQFRFNRKLMTYIKSLEGSKWHGYDTPIPRKVWSILDCPHNEFQLKYLQGENPYERYMSPLTEIITERPLYDHQKDMTAQMLQRHYTIVAGEMGVGKSLSWIEATEQAKISGGIWYIGPRAGVIAVRRELNKWEATFKPEMFTYDKLSKIIETWNPNTSAPMMICFDESSKVKNYRSKRSKAARYLADCIRTEHGWNGYVIEMCGTPTPRSPVDWWWQCEIAMPGFIKEGDEGKFKRRLCLTEQRESAAGGVYPHILTWLDDERKCAKCGEYEEHADHAEINMCEEGYHVYIASVNEVANLHTRMAGLVMVKWKKDCLDLPEKIYEIVEIKPTADMLRVAKLIRNTTRRGAQALNLLRELSDGFQYTKEVIGKIECPECFGTGATIVYIPKKDVDTLAPQEVKPENFIEKVTVCSFCGGAKKVNQYERGTSIVKSPKDEQFLDDLDNHDDVGRFIVWGGFQGTVDRLIEMSRKHGWCVLKIDGRGYNGYDTDGNSLDVDELLDAMDRSHPRTKELLTKYPKLIVVGQPGAGGMALTFTMAPTMVFFSNSFDGGARPQAEDRFHRIGMDANRAATVKDYICLPSDRLVLNNLKAKKKLQNLSMGEIEDAFTGAV